MSTETTFTDITVSVAQFRALPGVWEWIVARSRCDFSVIMIVFNFGAVPLVTSWPYNDWGPEKDVSVVHPLAVGCWEL